MPLFTYPALHSNSHLVAVQEVTTDFAVSDERPVLSPLHITAFVGSVPVQEYGTTSHVAPAFGVALKVPLVQGNVAAPVVGAVESVTDALLPLLVELVVLALQLLPPTVHVTEVPDGQEAAAATQAEPFHVYPELHEYSHLAVVLDDE